MDRFNLEILFDPFKKQFNLLALLVKHVTFFGGTGSYAVMGQSQYFLVKVMHSYFI